MVYAAFTPGQALRRPGSCRGAVRIRGGAELASSEGSAEENSPNLLACVLSWRLAVFFSCELIPPVTGNKIRGAKRTLPGFVPSPGLYFIRELDCE